MTSNRCPRGTRGHDDRPAAPRTADGVRPTATDTEMIYEYDNTDDRAAPVRGAIEAIDVEPDSNTPINVIGLPEGWLDVVGIANPPELVDVAIVAPRRAFDRAHQYPSRP